MFTQAIGWYYSMARFEEKTGTGDTSGRGEKLGIKFTYFPVNKYLIPLKIFLIFQVFNKVNLECFFIKSYFGGNKICISRCFFLLLHIFKRFYQRTVVMTWRKAAVFFKFSNPFNQSFYIRKRLQSLY